MGTKPRRGQRLFRRVLVGEAKQIIKTLLGQGRQRIFAVDNIIETLRNNGYGDTLEEQGQEALDNYFILRQGEAEAIQEYINREDMRRLQASESSPKGALDLLL